jgi:hypothetical protein
MDARLSHGWALVLGVWGNISPLVGTLIGTLVGIFVGNRLSRSSQREQWFRDKRYEDYQAVLSALVSAYTTIVRVDMASSTSLYTPEMLQEVEIIKADSFRVLRDRIFIAEELNYAGILVEWDTMVTNYGMHSSDEREFAGRFSELNDKLVRMALNPPRHPGWFERWRLRRLRRKFSRELAKSNLQKL